MTDTVSNISLHALVRDVKACRLCADELPLKPKPVIQVSPSARVLIVGQAPGIRVHETGLPFNDPSGDRLRSWLGVTRKEFYDADHFALLPMAFCFPGTGSSGDLPPPKRCAETWRNQLLSKLENLRFTLLCGKYAINWHLPEIRNKPLTEAIKYSWLSDASVLAIPHPSGRNNGWLAKNPWFNEKVVPEIQRRVQLALKTEK